MPKLTNSQHNILLWLNDQGDRVLYGPMGVAGIGSRERYGFAGGGPFSGIRLATGNKLLALGLIRHVKDKYPLGYHAITEAGREAVSPSPALAPVGAE